MGFLDRFGKKSIPANATFRTTQIGTAKLQDGFGGDAKSQILCALEAQGSSTVAEISAASGLSRSQVEKNIAALVEGGYVQYVSAQTPEM